ncbi:MAG TPA: hypothetical protein PKE47_02270, partial [Verrucomicrobiota bacterium]|nr:hypothetical protein [Verrucomicrobiota bacterium]
ALVAAFSSIGTLCINLFAQYRSEMRATYRKTLEPFLEPLGKNLYLTMACSKILSLKNDEDGESRGNWRKRADEARNEIKKLRMNVRYSLWGLDEPLRVLTRVPNWIEHNKGNRENSDALILLATNLREAIDDSIRRAYSCGKPIPFWNRWLLNKKAGKLRNQYECGAPPEFRYTDEVEEG